MMYKRWVWCALLILLGCDASENGVNWRRQELERTMNTSVYNYTGHNLTEVRFKLASLPFKIQDAAAAGSVYLRNASKIKMDNGQSVFYSSRDCCFYWDKNTRENVSFRVVWQVVYDLSLFEGESGNFDHRTSKQAAPGSRWCEAIVPIRGPYPEQADNLVLHFLRDGTVEALLGDGKDEKPLSSAEVASHAAQLPKGQYCLKEIENPWFGIPRKPHVE